MKYAWIEGQRLYHRIETLCRVLSVSRAGYYSWRGRRASRRTIENERLLVEIRALYFANRGRYGSPRLHDELKDRGIHVGRHRVARLMSRAGLHAKAASRFKATTNSSHNQEVAPDLLQRDFYAAAPDTVYVGDITYVWTDEGWMYLAVWIDLYSRMVVGWAMERTLNTSLVCAAFERACMRRSPAAGIVVHSDRGAQYASGAFKSMLKRVGARQSMSLKGDCWGNAVAESFFHSFKVEAVYGERFETRRKMEYETFDYIERFYNKKRKHSTLGLRSPLEFEQQYSLRAAA